jgi:hypothetical protein
VGGVLGEQQRGDEEAGEDEEGVDAEVATVDPPEVEGDDGGHGQAAESVEGWDVGQAAIRGHRGRRSRLEVEV